MSRDAVEGFLAAVRAALGAAPDSVEPGELHRFSTSGRRGDLAGWCKLFPDLRGGVYGCYRQGISEAWTLRDRQSLSLVDRAQLLRQVAASRSQRQQHQNEQWAKSATLIAAQWAKCRPLEEGDAASLYLARRGLGDQPLPACLRLHPWLPYWEEGRKTGHFPALVAPIVSADGRMLALHRTYLTPDGQKAPVPTVRKLSVAAGLLAGASIPLASPRGGVIGIAEGIETAMAAQAASGVPTVAAYSAGNLAQWRWPAGLKRLVVFADNDPAGTQAAKSLRVRALSVGLACEIQTPETPGTDWCDVWASRLFEVQP